MPVLDVSYLTSVSICGLEAHVPGLTVAGGTLYDIEGTASKQVSMKRRITPLSIYSATRQQNCRITAVRIRASVGLGRPLQARRTRPGRQILFQESSYKNNYVVSF
jgi:hypothetical protein